MKIDVVHGKVTIKGKGGDLPSLTPVPGGIGLRIASGTNSYCAYFGGSIKYPTTTRFLAKRAPKPAACSL